MATQIEIPVYRADRHLKKQKAALGKNCTQKQSCLYKNKPIDMVRKWIYAILNTQITKDESLRKFDTVYPAAGNGHTAVKLTLQELEAAAGAEGWVDVCKEPEGE